MEYINGQTYKINHSRKGVFTAQVNSQDDTWLNCTIVSGKAGAILKYNERETGEEITVRKSLIRNAEKQTQHTPAPRAMGRDIY